MKFVFSAATVILVACLAAPGHAQQPVRLEIRNGRVNLKAENAAVRQILAEWARIGGTRIVNGERVTGAPVTLELTNVPERQALDIVLRNVAGYMLAARQSGSGGASEFDRILILPTSTAPRNPVPAAAAGPPGRPVPPSGVPPDDDPAEGQPEEVAEDPTVAVDGRPRPLPPRVVGRVPPGPLPGVPQPLVQQPPTEPAVDEPTTQTTPIPGNPFGMPPGSSARPGMVAPVPAPRQPAR